MSKRKATRRIDSETKDRSQVVPTLKTIPGPTSRDYGPPPQFVAKGDPLVESRVDEFVCIACGNIYRIDWTTAWIDSLMTWLETHGGKCNAAAALLGNS